MSLKFGFEILKNNRDIRKVYILNGQPSYNLALIAKAVSEKMFENNGNIHVYSPGAGADTP